MSLAIQSTVIECLDPRNKYPVQIIENDVDTTIYLDATPDA